MAQQIDDQAPAGGDVAGRDAIDAWIELDQKTPDREAGDASAAARVAASLLQAARGLRARYGDQMLSFDPQPRALELHELLHVTERNALAAQRHGVETLTARLRADDSAVRDIARQTFVRVEDAAAALEKARSIAQLMPTTTASEPIATEMAAETTVADERETERFDRAARMRRARPLPETPIAAPVEEPRRYSLLDDPWPDSEPPARDEPQSVAEQIAAEQMVDAPSHERVELSAEPVTPGSDDLASADTGMIRYASTAELEIIEDSVKPSVANDLPRPLWFYRLLVIALVGLIVFGLWLLLSGDSFIS